MRVLWDIMKEQEEEKLKTKTSRLHKLERIGIVSSVIAVILSLGFNIWDKLDYRKQIAKNEKQIISASYDKIYSDVTKGLYGGEKLKKAIYKIIDNGDDLSGMNLSRKSLVGIKLKGQNLYATNFSESIFHATVDDFYSKGSLESVKSSDLSNAYLVKANLDKASLSFANLQQADLRYASLKETSLTRANLENAILTHAVLQNAKLEYANLQNALLKVVDFKDANLAFAKFQKANLSHASINEAYIYKANFNEVILKGASFHLSDLRDTSFQNAILESTNFQEANLQNANFSNADLRKANLLKVLNLTVEQLSKAKTLYKASLDPGLMEQVKEKRPHLFEVTKEVESKQDE